MINNEAAAALETEAQTYLANRQFDEARNSYARICEIVPDDADSWLMLGAIEGELGRPQEALTAVRRAIDLDGRFAEAHLTLAHLLLGAGDVAGARVSATRATEIDPEYGEAHLLGGALNGQLGDYAAAVSASKRAVQLLPESSEALANLGNALNQLGQFAEAESAYRKALHMQPGRIELLSGLGNVLAGLGQADEAIEVLERAKLSQADYADVYTGLGAAWLSKGEFEKALTHFQQRLELTPGFSLGKVHQGVALRGLGRTEEAEASFSDALASGDASTMPLAWNMMGTVRVEEGKPEEALACYERALELNPDYVVALDNSGRALEALGRFEEALEKYERVAELIPGVADFAANRASVLQRMGQAEQALPLVEPFLEGAAITPRLAEVFSRLCNQFERCDEAVTLIEGLLNRALADKDSRPLHFSLGKLYDKRGAYEDAFRHFEAANALKRVEYDPAAFTQYVDGLISTFSRGVLELLPRPALSSAKPIFIVGMPRSGTSLVEQILASHPDVFGAGELRNVFDLVDALPPKLGGMPYPLCVPSMTQPVVDMSARAYLDALDEMAPGSPRVTDKMPHNFLHLGLIHVLFPLAKIVHCVRDPLDTCLSCYFQDFTGHHPYAYDLGNLGAHYRDYQRLMTHWKDTVGMPIFDVHYDQLVNDQEAASRALLEFCGLEWDDACLRFHESERTTRTASFDQVRQPVYTSSLQRWRHYDAWIDSLKQALGA